MDQESAPIVSVVPTITAHAAKMLLDHAEGIAIKMGISGFAVVYSRTGMQEGSLAIGEGGTPLNVSIALDKIKTVLATRRSTSAQQKRMVSEGRDRADYAGQIGSLFGGGVALFHNDQFVGAMAFSGGTPDQDQELCVRAALAAGLQTDIGEESEAWGVG